MLSCVVGRVAGADVALPACCSPSAGLTSEGLQWEQWQGCGLVVVGLGASTAYMGREVDVVVAILVEAVECVGVICVCSMLW